MKPLLLCVIGLAFLDGAHQAQADTTLTDCTPAALRVAVGLGGNVVFGCSNTIALTSPIEVTTDTTLDAGGQRVVITGSTNQTQLFRVRPGVVFTLKGVTLLNGRSPTNGGAIYNGGKLVASDCVFSNNIALAPNGPAGQNGADQSVKGEDGRNGGDGLRAAGGAIYNVCTAIVTRCVFLTNGVFAGNGGQGGKGGNGDTLGGNGGDGGWGGTALGGAIYSSGRLRVTNCLFQFNYVVGGKGGAGGTNGTGASSGYLGDGGAGGMGVGGALFLLERSFTVGSTFDRDYAFSGDSANGGTEPNVGPPGKEGPDSQGGAICNKGTNLLVNCTFSGNGVAAGRGGVGTGSPLFAGDGGDGGDAWGGSYYNGSWALVTNCTFVGGITLPGPAGQTGTGGISGDSGTLGQSRGGNVAHNGLFFSLQNCLLASAKTGTNSSFTANLSAGLNAFGSFTDGGYNLSDDSTPAFSSGTSRGHTEALAGTLGNYGGSTPTIPLLPGSPALDQVPSGFPATDQRAIPRPVRDLADIGAYEAEGLTIGGRITEGPHGLPGVTLTAGQKTAVTDANGYYVLYGLSLGATKTIVPSLMGHAFTPASASVTVVPGITNVDFTSQLRIAIVISNRQVQLVLGGIPLQSYEIQASTDLGSSTSWETLSTVTAGPDGLIHFWDPTPADLPSRFYRIRPAAP